MIWQIRSHFDKGTRSFRVIFSYSSYEEEVMSLLKIISEGVYVDGTIGLGGHSESILSQLSEQWAPS